MSGRRRPPAAPAQAQAPAQQVHYPQQVSTVQTFSQRDAEVSIRTEPNAPPTRYPQRLAPAPQYAQPAPQYAPRAAPAPQPAPVRYTQDPGGAWHDGREAEPQYAQPAQQARPWRRFSERVRESTQMVQEDRAQFSYDDLVDAVGEQAADAGNAFFELLSLGLTVRQSPLTPAVEDKVNALVDAIDTHAAAAQGLYHGSRQQYGDQATQDAGDLAHDVPAVARIARVLAESILRPELRGQVAVQDDLPPPRWPEREEAPAPAPDAAPPASPAKAEKQAKADKQ